MKKKQVLALLLTSCLLLTACNNGTNNSTSSNLPVGTNETTTTEDEETEESRDNTTTEETADKEDEAAEDAITITYETDDEEYTAENGDLIFEYRISYPVVNIKDNTTAQELINANLQEQRQSFQEYIQEAKEDATSFYEQSTDDEYPTSSYASYDYYEHRIDENIISFERIDYFYLGGAHGEGVYTGLNYDAKTGDLLTLNDIFTDPELAMEQLNAHLSYLASLPYYRELMYEDVDADISCLLEEGSWYFAKDGIHFVAQPYALGPYSSGNITFTVPYEKLSDLKEDYQYDTFLLQTCVVGESMTTWLDGDDNADTIIYDVINPYATYPDINQSEEYAETTFSLEINGKDFSQDLIDAVDFISDGYSCQYYVVDIDKSDNYKELVIADYGYSDDPLTHFFHYENDTLKYLGTVADVPGNDYFIVNGDGTVNARMTSNLMQTPYIPAVYELKGDSLSLVDTDWYKIEETNWTEDYQGHNILTDVMVYTEADLNSETITLTPEDGPVSFPASDNKNWYQVQTKDGTIYYLYLTDFSTVPNNGTDMDAYEIFDNLFIAG